MSMRVASAIGTYVVLVTVSAMIFYWLRQSIDRASPMHYLYALCGPSLSLFTHMGYLLFGLQSLFLLPWLVLRAVWPQTLKIAVPFFVACWLCVGWWMHDLF
jgi:hypothetical protein